MRLTLRTLLAYRDRVLNANELEDMHGRVQQSAMASNLVKRLQSLSQRTNILAPPIEGKGLGADANSIAEYLDDSLKGDKVPELERICLESDVQLAELAQCHSLLSAALSTAVDVPDALRQRVAAFSDEAVRKQALARRHSEAAENPDANNANNASPTVRPVDAQREDAGPVEKKRFRTEDAHTQPGEPVANGKATKKNERADLVAAQAVTAPMVASGGDSIRPSGLDLEGSHLAHEVPEYLRGRSRDGWLGPVAIGGLLCLLGLLVWQSIGSWSSVRDMFTLSPDESPSVPANSKEAANSNEAVPLADNNPGNKANNTASPSAADSTLNGSGAAVPNGSTLNGAMPSKDAVVNLKQPSATDPQAEATRADNLRSVGGASSQDNAASAATSSAANDALSVAQWLPADAKAMQAVMLVQAGEATLQRLKPSQSIPSGCQLFVPSANRPRLDITRGPQWQICGTTHALLILPDSSPTAEPQVDMRLGRAVATGSRAGESIALVTPAGNARLILANGAAASVELSYVPRAHGAVTNRAVYVPTLSIVGLQGEPSIELGTEKIQVSVGKKINIQSNKAGALEAAQPPLWIDSSFDRPVDLEAAKDLASKLTGDAAVGDVLQTLATGRRPETRAIAAQTLSLLGNWDWVTQAKSSFSDARDRSFWAALLDRTRQILAAHPENVAVLEASLNQLDHQSAKWRLMLWLGLEAEQLQADGAKKIVASLENATLLERVLAIQQLQRATGKDFGYAAGEPNRTIVSQWDRELNSGKLRLLPVPQS